MIGDSVEVRNSKGQNSKSIACLLGTNKTHAKYMTHKEAFI